MQRYFAALLLLTISLTGIAQPTLQRPKLVVGIVLDQMRWDYLYRYYDRFDINGGFRRMLAKGFTCENTMIPYAPTVTACGHSTIYTGSVPAITGITGNSWWSRKEMRVVYCTEDKLVNTVGSNSNRGLQSPRNMFANTIGDELRLATNFKSKVVGIAIKDRGSILPAGHGANAAYWYDNSTGDWISSTYYMKDLPVWASQFNKKKLVDQYYRQGWKLMHPEKTYTQSTADEKKYESSAMGNKFPYDLSKFIGKDYSKIATTPMGNTLTAEFAKAAITGEQLGMDNITDLLTISFSSPDLIGHDFGPNSIEAEDAFLKIDKELGTLLDFIDAKVGKGQYTVFLSADHGVAHIPEFLEENKLPGGRLRMGDIIKELNKDLSGKYNIEKLIVSDYNYQIHFNHHAIDSAKIDLDQVMDHTIRFLNAQTGIDRAFALEDLNETPLPSTIREMLNNGYHPERNGDIQFILRPGFVESWSGNTGTTHGLWNPYDAHIPLVWYGWGIKQGKSNKEVYMNDIAPTLAALLHIQMPNGCTGQVITDVLK